mmetsp:Transcript_7273/g.24143  ORF Transcript_7273/g.24143 Transcript_7273/m.24143 type:complete len:251 (-) Transcript_7273:1507-2259(-)
MAGHEGSSRAPPAPAAGAAGAPAPVPPPPAAPAPAPLPCQPLLISSKIIRAHSSWSLLVGDDPSSWLRGAFVPRGHPKHAFKRDSRLARSGKRSRAAESEPPAASSRAGHSSLTTVISTASAVSEAESAALTSSMACPPCSSASAHARWKSGRRRGSATASTTAGPARSSARCMQREAASITARCDIRPNKRSIIGDGVDKLFGITAAVTREEDIAVGKLSSTLRAAMHAGAEESALSNAATMERRGPTT